MQRQMLPLLLIISACAFTAGAVDTPQALVKKAADAWGGQDAFEKLGVLRFDVSQSDTYSEGDTTKDSFVAYFDTSLNNSRIEFQSPPGLVTVRNLDTGWAMKDGQPDRRQQTPRMVPGINHKKLVPLFLPFTLQFDGIRLGSTAKESEVAGTPAYLFTIEMQPMFFETPVISRRWQVFVARDDYRILAAGYLPVEEYISVQEEGMQYRVLETTTINGITLPTLVQVEGVDKNGMVTGHSRKVKIKIQVVDEPSPALFLRPDKLQAIEDDE